MKSGELIEKLMGIEAELEEIAGILAKENRVFLAEAIESAKKKIDAVSSMINEAATMDTQGELNA
jgi:hypothetical protein